MMNSLDFFMLVQNHENKKLDKFWGLVKEHNIDLK